MTVTLDPATATNGGVLSGGNLTFTFNGASGNVCRSTYFTTTDNFYFEVKYVNISSGAGFCGLGVVLQSQSTVTPTTIVTVPAGFWEWRDDSFKINSGAGTAYGTNAATNDIFLCACAPRTGNLWFGRNGTWFASGDPAAGTNPSFTGVTGSMGALVNLFGNVGSPSVTFNFGDSAFVYTIPTGFFPLSRIPIFSAPFPEIINQPDKMVGY